MTSIGSPSPFFLAGKKAYEIERSLRFNGADGSYLARTPSSASNQKKMTFSFWFKRAVNDSFTTVFRSFGNADNRHGIDFVSGGQLRLWGNYNGSVAMTVQPTQVFRDFSAWYHFVLVLDTEQGTASNRVKMYINGNQITDFATATYPAQNFEFGFNDANAETQIGTNGGTSCNFYIAEFQEIDGLALDPSYFAETDAITGQWIPKKYTGSYGTNGFYLNFSNTSSLGADSSGNSNNFTPNNFSTSAGAGNDSLTDTPTNNFCTLSQLLTDTRSDSSFSQGNLTVTTGSGASTVGTTFAQTTGKWYAEFVCTAKSSTNMMIGVNSVEGFDGERQGNESQNGGVGYGYINNGNNALPDGSNNSYGATWAINDVMGIALDLDNNTVNFYKNNAAQGTISISDGYNYVMTCGHGQGGVTATFDVNFGQRAFSYTPPTGFKALNSANLPDPTILLPNKHFDIDLYTGTGSTLERSSFNFQPDWLWFKSRSASGHNHALFDSVRGRAVGLSSDETYSEFTSSASNDLVSFDDDGFTVGGNQNFASVNGSGTKVAWAWNAGDTDGKTYTVKVHDFSGNNRYIFDDFQTQAVTLDLAEGGTYIFNMDDASNASHPFSIGTAANGTVYTSGITYFLDGVSKTYNEYTLGFSTASTRRLHITVPASVPVLYYWCSVHSGMGGQINTNSTLGSSNFDGTLQSTVKVNATAGFSIVSYTVGNFSGMTMGHGLGVSPVIAISKKRSGTSDWSVQFINKSDSSTDYMFLNKRDAPGDTSTYFTSTTVKDGFGTGSNGDTIIQYVFSEVAGYSKFGSYTGNGSSDGTFVFTGFRPAWLLIKADLSESWYLYDNKRNTFNVVDKQVRTDHSYAEGTFTTADFLSNGFKIRQTDSAVNQSGATYFYLAFAESPFKYARAR